MKRSANSFKRNRKQVLVIAIFLIMIMATAVAGTMLLAGGATNVPINAANVNLDGSKIAAGMNHSLAIDDDGYLWAWGRNDLGQLGDGTNTDRLVPVKITHNNNKYTAVAAGAHHSFAIDTAGNLWAWGLNDDGRLGDGTFTNRNIPVRIGNNKYTAVAAGDTHSLAIDNTGVLWTWGRNNFGQLGNGRIGTYENSNNPVRIGETTRFSAVAAGSAHSLAIDTDGSLWAWGSNNYGQLGDGTGVMDAYSNIPVRIDYNNNEYTAVEAGGRHSLALDTEGHLWAWGSNTQGQLGDGTKTDRNVPMLIEGNTYKAIAAGDAHNFAIDTDGFLWTMGRHYYGYQGIVTNNRPVQVGSSKYTAAEGGFNHSLVISDEGCSSWGGNDYGQLGNGTAKYSSCNIPILVQAIFIPVTITYNANGGTLNSDSAIKTANYAKVIGAQKTARRTGYSFSGWYTLASGGIKIETTTVLNTTNISAINISGNPYTLNLYAQWTAPQVLDISDDSRIAAGMGHNLAIDNEGYLWTWGWNMYGQLGNEEESQYSDTPELIGDNKYKAVAAGYWHSLAIDADGYLWTWGWNIYGQLGNGSRGENQKLNAPVQIGDKKFTAIAAGAYHSLAIDTDGYLWAWGLINTGIDGFENAKWQVLGLIPTQVGINKYIAIAAGFYHSLAIDVAGNLWAWGRNNAGQLGDSTYIDRNTLVKIGSNMYSAISAGWFYSLAVDSAGKLWAWGDNTAGQLGNGVKGEGTGSNAPVHIAGNTYTVVWASRNHSFAIDVAGDLWAWGDNLVGQLGDGTNNYSNSPVKINYNNNKYLAVSASDMHSIALDNAGNLWAWGVNGNGELGTGTSTSSNIPVLIKALFIPAEIIPVTITYNPNGGALNPVSPNTRTVNYNISIGAPLTAERTGYTLTGWYTAASGGIKVATTTKLNVTNIPTINTSNSESYTLTLHAQWTLNTLSITYNYNNGTGSPNTATVNYNASITLPTATRAGYIFNGWTGGALTNATGSRTGQQILSTLGTGSGSVTLVAQWAPDNFSVTFNAAGGTGAPEAAPGETLTENSMTGWTFGTSKALPTAGTLSRTRYTFAGWGTQSDGLGTAIWAPGATVTISGQPNTATNINIITTKTLYAQWVADNSVIITFKAEDGSIIGTVTEALGVSVNVPAEIVLTKLGTNGYNWYKEGTREKVTFPMNMPEHDMSVMLEWEYINYTVKFVANEIIVKKITTARYGSFVIEYLPKLEDLTIPSGKKFEGWQGYSPEVIVVGNHTFTAVFVDNDAKTSEITFVYLDATGNDKSEPVTAVIGQEIYIYLLDMTVAARKAPDRTFVGWQGYTKGQKVTNDNLILTAIYKDTDSTPKVTIKFYDSDGKKLIHEIEVLDGTQIWLITPPVMEKTGKKFNGWKTDYTGSEVDSNRVSEIVFTAVWTEPQGISVEMILMLIALGLSITLIFFIMKRNRKKSLS